MKLKPLQAGWMEKDSRRGMLAAYLNALADLAGSKRTLPVLRDASRLDAYAAAMRRVLAVRPGERLCRGFGITLLKLCCSESLNW